MDAGYKTRHDLPDWHEVSAAIRYVTGDKPGDHLVTRWTRALAQLHRTRRVSPDRVSEIDRRRAELVVLINQWVATHLAPSSTDADEVGPVADALVAAYIDAESLLMAPDEVAAETLHSAWSRVGYLATRWGDLVAAVVDGQPCPPGRC
ncbi:hypothetical protein IFM12275_30090 [Nocardia sputorum]|uniref:hypothetical protein n=1 Tax=Nocardia sputorum TaxID=2984338 RepID=UPI002490BC1D|nr:hypothetical protein [Nocardia sputorum]BDT93033.1 hypothetical protein IFM12275_30090 [Nocardia sputorum]